MFQLGNKQWESLPAINMQWGICATCRAFHSYYIDADSSGTDIQPMASKK